jgi:short-subunit dehydrogenase
MSTLQPVTIVTGASSGIGAALARVFAEHGHRLVLVARRESALAAVAQQIAAAGKATPGIIAIDLSLPGACDRLAAELAHRGVEPAVIVNSAGFGMLGRASELSLSEQLTMIDLNVRVLTELSLRWLDSLARHRGGIVNVGSLTGFFPGPTMAVYHSTKAYALSFGESLHHELKSKGIRVTTLCPGPVETDFMARAGVIAGDYPRSLVHAVDRVARDGYNGFVAGRAVVITGFLNRLSTLLPRLLPRALITRIVAFSQSGRRKAMRR